MQIGVAIWPFQWMPPYEDALRRVRRLGFRAVELIAWDRGVLAGYYTPRRVAELVKLLADEGLALSEFVFSPQGISEPDAGRRAAAVEDFARAADTAKALGAAIINSVVATPFGLATPRLLDLPQAQEATIELPRGLDWADGCRFYVDVLRDCCAVCERAGLRYALEAHPHRWATTAMGLLRLIDRVGSPALGVNLDPSHTFPCGDLPQMAAYELGDRIFHAHVSDNDGQTNAHWRPGKGKIDWAGTLAALDDVGYAGAISIELEDVPGRASRLNPTATEAFDRENLEARRYLAEIAARLDIELG